MNLGIISMLLFNIQVVFTMYAYCVETKNKKRIES